MTKEFKFPPVFPAPDGWEYTGEIRRLRRGEGGVSLEPGNERVIFEWSQNNPSLGSYWIIAPTYPKSVDILGVTVTVEDVYGTMDPSIPEGWKVKSFSVPTKDDLSVTVLHPTGGWIAALENFPSYLPSKHHKRMVIATPLLLLEKIA